MGSVIEGGGIQGSSYVQGAPGSRGEDGSSQGAMGGIAQAGKEQVKKLGGVTRGRVYEQVDSRKGELVKGIQGLASTLEDASRKDDAAMVRPLLDGAAGVLRKASDRLENGTTEELVRDAQSRVRERPGLFIAGCVALGFAFGRMIKV